MSKPFLLIASIRRTGSTVLAEALSQLPHALILNETYIGYGHFVPHRLDREMLLPYGIDLNQYRDRWKTQKRPSLVPAFRAELVPALLEVVDQVGTKEIRLRGWQDYCREFPEIRIILTARDPRDIYISLRGRYMAGNADWKGSFTPQRVASDLLEEFEHQVAMYERGMATKVRYEDLCTDPDEVLGRVRSFSQNDVPGVGSIGHHLSGHDGRRREHALHQGRLTAKQVARWKGEKDPEVRREADHVFDLMPEYRTFWGYD